MRRRGRVWYVYWREDGRKIERRVSTSQRLARAFLNRLRARLDHQRAGFPYQDLLLTDLWAFHEGDLLARRRAGDLAASSLTRAREAWAAFTAWRLVHAAGVRTVSDLTPYLLRQYQLARATKVKARTVNTELLLIGAAFRRAAKDHRIDGSPFDSLRPLKELDSREPIRLTADQVVTLIRKADPELQPYILGAVYTGARRGELFAVRWEDVDLEAGVLRLQNIKTRRHAKERERQVPIHPRLGAVLEGRRHLARGPWADLPAETLRRKFKAAARAAELPAGVTFHSLRHSVGTILSGLGVSRERIQALLGHRDARMTAHYAKVLVEPLRGEVGKLDFGA